MLYLPGTHLPTHLPTYMCTYLVDRDLGTYLGSHVARTRTDRLEAPVRPRAPLNLLHLAGRGSSPTLYRRRLRRPDPSRPADASNSIVTANTTTITTTHSGPDAYPLGPQDGRRLPRDQGAEASRAGRHRPRPEPRPRR